MGNVWECWVDHPRHAVAVVGVDVQEAAEHYALDRLVLCPLDEPEVVHVRAHPGAPVVGVEVWLGPAYLPPPASAMGLEIRSNRLDAPIDWEKWTRIEGAARRACDGSTQGYLEALESVLEPHEVDLRPRALAAYYCAREARA